MSDDFPILGFVAFIVIFGLAMTGTMYLVMCVSHCIRRRRNTSAEKAKHASARREIAELEHLYGLEVRNGSHL